MKLFNPMNFFKKSAPKIQGLTLDQLATIDTGFRDSVFWTPNTIRQSLLIYSKISPAYDAIDRIATEFTTIKPMVFDTKKNEFVSEHPILELFKNPNPFNSRQSFFYDLSTFFLATGNSFYAGTGPVMEPPLEIDIIRPEIISISSSDSQKVKSYRVDDFDLSHMFNLTSVADEFGLRDAMRLGRFRYYEKDALEFFHIKNFNPLPGIGFNRHFGMSKLTPLFFENEQFEHLSTHNLSLLRRGATIGGILAIEGALSEDQREALTQQLNNLHTGSENTGRTMVTEGGAKWIDNVKTNKDMDFMNLKKSNVTSIYNAYRVPLPLVLAETMTLANMDAARLALFENAVLPLTKILYSELTRGLLRRYPDSQNLILSFDPFDIPALEAGRVDTVNEISKAGVMTINELRTLLGKEGVENGDEIFLPANLIPSLRDLFTGDNLSKPRPGSSRVKVIDILKNMTLEDGGRYYSDKDIKLITDTVYADH